MTSFQTLYQTIFDTFGYPLGASASLPPAELAEAEQRLGMRLPAALRDYYLVAGRETQFNTCCHRLLPPSKWFVEKKRLVFMEENQMVCANTAWHSSRGPPQAAREAGPVLIPRRWLLGTARDIMRPGAGARDPDRVSPSAYTTIAGSNGG
jgi:hypothetical protein